MSCRNSCGGGCGGGILPTFARVPLPSSTVLAFTAPRLDAAAPSPSTLTASPPRAPPRA
jgi:hypothetical protein